MLVRIPASAPLSTWRQHRGARLQLACSACGWSKAYDPARIVDRLKQLGRGDGETPAGEVARHVQWPCPMCRRMRWRSALAAPRL